MSRRKQAGVVGSATTGMRVGAFKHSRPLMRASMLVIGALVILGVVIGIAYVVHNGDNNGPIPASPTISAQTFQSEVTRLQYDEGLGHTTKALADVNGYLAQTLTKSQRVSFLEEKATIYENEQNLAQAKSVYLESAKLQNGKVDVATAQGLLYIYETEGNKSQEALYCSQLNADVRAVKDPVLQSNLPTCNVQTENAQ